MTLSAFGKSKFSARPPQYTPATISDFSGGLNVVDNDVTMKTKYATVLTNMERDVDGSMGIRFGTGYKFDVTGTVTGTIVDFTYFRKSLVVVMSTGQIARITEDGTKTKIWDDAIAALLPGAPDGWNVGFSSVSFHEFKGSLLIHNGQDKPLIVDKDFDVEYLNDPATGSNINTPTGKYGTTVGNYAVIAGIASATGDVYISNAGTSGVWVGDADPNDGISMALGAYAPQTTGDIIGLGSFRNTLFVFFEGALVILELGIYDEAVHTPKVQDTIIENGIINNRTKVATKTDFIFSDMLGVFSAARNSFGLMETKIASDLIDPEYQKTAPFDTVERTKAFSVLNKNENRYLTFVPVGTDDMLVWSMSFKEGVKSPAWSIYTGWQFTSGCATEKGRVFLALGTKIFQYGNETFAGEDYSADFVGEYDSSWLTATAYVVGDRVLKDDVVYVVLEDHTSGVFDDDVEDDLLAEYEGEDIVFDWELPWSDIGKRANKKGMRYIQADTEGTAEFHIDVFVDKYYLDSEGEYDPAVSMVFVGGSSGGYGNLDQPYGGGRRMGDERPWGLPSDFKIIKLRIRGATKKPLRIFTMTLYYLTGTLRR